MSSKVDSEMTGPSADSAKRPELVFGLVAPLGTDIASVAECLKNELNKVNYRSEVYRLSRLMRDLKSDPWKSLKDGPLDEEIDAHMRAGNELRQKTGRNNALALLAIGAIREFRQKQCGDANKPAYGHSHILHSLKRPEEVDSLRRIYGSTFFVISIYSPRFRRLQDLAKRIAESRHSNQSVDYQSQAEALLRRDEAEIGNPYGQDVQDAFPLGDVFVDASDRIATQNAISRFIELLFGNTFHTPTRDEQGMFCAQAASYRSASLARQVGACICRPDGSIVSLGVNEVAAPGGQQYWCGSGKDGRDYLRGRDTSDLMRENILGDILKRLEDNGWLAENIAGKPVGDLVKEALYEGNPSIMKGAQFTSTIDYVRAVHAEMAAITAAALHGVSTRECVLYTTTFPCHDCAKHIVAAGIARVVYIEPYPKSLVQELFDDSIAIDTYEACTDRVKFQPFVGVAPRRYADMFALMNRKRKRPDGTTIVWQSSTALPNLTDQMPSSVTRIAAEQEVFENFKRDMSKVLELKNELG